MTVTASGESEEIAYREADSQVPNGAERVGRRTLTPPTARSVSISASDAETAEASIRARLGAAEKLRGLRPIDEPKPGFLGIGRKPGNYEADILCPAKVVITYIMKPVVRAWIGDSRAKPVVEALKDWYKNSAGGRVGKGFCDDCNDRLTPDETYLRPGGYMACEDCTDVFLCAYTDWPETALNLNRAVGPGVPAEIQRLASETWA